MFTFLPHISRIVFWASCGFVIGVWSSSFGVIDRDMALFVLALVGCSMIILFYRKNNTWLILIFIMFSAWGFLVLDQKKDGIEMAIAVSEGFVEGYGQIMKGVEQKEFNAHVFVRLDGEDFLTLLTAEKHDLLHEGDRLFVSCTRSVPENFAGFDYRSYLAMRGVLLVCNDPIYSVEGHENTMMSQLGLLRSKMESIVNNIIPAPESALANGLLFGGSTRLSQELQNAFSRTGMTHIVAVSGYNVSIIIAVVMGGLIYVGLWRKWAVWYAIFAVVLFVALIGFPSSGVRAALMGIMVLVAAVFGRVTHAYSAIVLVAAVMLFFNPLLLRYDVGFQLSFLATLGIVAVYPFLERLFIKKNMAFGLSEVLFLTVAAQVFVVPIIAYHFHTFSVVSLLVNLLVLPIIPFTMFFVALMIPLSMIFYPAATLAGWVAYFLLKYEVFVITLFSQLPLSSISFENITFLHMFIYYGLIVLILFYLNRKMSLYEL